jgi:hypothetical protein
MGVELDAWHDDQDCSGGNVERPGFLEVIRRIEAAAAQDPDLRQPLPGGWFRATAHVCRHDA